MKIFLVLALSFGGIFAMADDQVIPAPQPSYTVVNTRSASCTRHDNNCVNNLRNQAIYDAQVSSYNYCKNNFGNSTKVLDWDANCSSFMVNEVMRTPYPQPPQPPDFPKSVTCTARFDFVCEI